MGGNCLIINFYNKYKELIHFNKNIVTSAIITAVIDIFIVRLGYFLYSNNSFAISLISLIADFTIYNFIFILLFFECNKHKYKNDDGTKKIQKIKKDFINLLTTIGLSELAYLSIKFSSTYSIFLYLKIDPLEISLISTILAWIAYLTIANIMVKRNDFIRRNI
ncbi:MAG TPA: hypothetical protein VIY08_07940 [Candidatus Nitrosocosmicus sp.]